jgi:hypothetical protein
MSAIRQFVGGDGVAVLAQETDPNCDAMRIARIMESLSRLNLGECTMEEHLAVVNSGGRVLVEGES